MAMTSVTKCLRHIHCTPLSNYLKVLQHCKRTSYSTDAVSFTRRTNNCGSLRYEDVGTSVRLCGWLQYHRMGGTFLVLRDWQGLTQLIIPKDKTQLVQTVSQLDYETVVEVTGVVRTRPDEQQNKNMATGDIEVQVEDLCVLNSVTPDLPFHIRDSQGQVNEALRMEYRYLDLRSRQMQRNLRLRSKMIMKMREFLANKHGFVDVETPTLFRRTPGGAKEFVVPSRHRGKFYSLPQSPQQFKQLLMVGGIDRYYQVARCYRDEGSKPDRQPEFTQLDLEMSFVDREGIIDLIEEMMQFSWPQGSPAPATPFPCMTYDQVMRLYGVDKPDTRFDMKLHDVTSLMEGCGSKLLEEKIQTEGGAAVAIKVNDKQRLVSNKDFEQMKNEVSAILNNAQNVLITVRIDDSRHWHSPIAKHIHEDTKHVVTTELDLQPGDLVVLATGQGYAPHECLGRLRLKLADHLEKKGVPLRNKEEFNFLWVLDFPLFLPAESREGLESAHHPFTNVHPEDRHMLYSHPHKVRGQHYDLVLNGNEVGGGSIRIHDPDVQRYVLEDVLKEDPSQLEHLLQAFSMGCPPHGGIALGLDRLFAVITGSPSIRDVIAFPKSHDGQDPMSRAPAYVSQKDLDMYHIQVKPETS